MKLLILLLLITGNALALPVLNESVATNSIYTIYPDHQDENLYYISPNYMGIARDEDGIPLFNYTEYKVGWRRYRATAQVILRVNNYEEELSKAKETVLSYNAKARFALIPFYESEILFNDKFGRAILSHACTHPAGEYSAEQSCILNFSHFGKNIFKNSIHKRLTLVMNFSYQVIGVNATADNSFVETERKFMLAARIGGNILAQYPELFTDWKGRIIDL